MSLSETLTLWDGALAAWDGSREAEALKLLSQIKEPSSKILFNFGTAHLCMGDVGEALKFFLRCIAKDEHFALAYFQKGVALFKLNRFDEAQLQFQKSEDLLRGKHFIDYAQLGLRYKLYKCECQMNAAICLQRLGYIRGAEEIMQSAKGCTAERRHQIIKDNLDALQNGGEPKLMEVARECMFRPSKQMIANLPKKNYLGEAKVIAAATSEEAEFSGFSGPRRVDQGEVSEGQADPSPYPKKMSIDSALASVAMLGRGPILGSYGAPPDRPPPTPPNQNRNRSLPNTSVVRHSSDPDVLEINEALKQVQAQQSLLQHRALGRQKSSSVPNSPRGSTGSLTPPELPSKPPTSAKPSWKASNKTNGERPVVLQKSKTLVTVMIHCKDTVAIHVPSGSDISEIHRKAASALDVNRNKYELWYRRPDGDTMVRISTNDQLQNLWTKDSLQFWFCSK